MTARRVLAAAVAAALLSPLAATAESAATVVVPAAGTFSFTVVRTLTVDLGRTELRPSSAAGAFGVWIESGDGRTHGGTVRADRVGTFVLGESPTLTLRPGRYAVTAFGTSPGTAVLGTRGSSTPPRLTRAASRHVQVRARSVEPDVLVTTAVTDAASLPRRSPRMAFFATRVDATGPVGDGALTICVRPLRSPCGSDGTTTWGSRATRIVEGGIGSVALFFEPGAPRLPRNGIEADFTFRGVDLVTALHDVTVVVY